MFNLTYRGKTFEVKEHWNELSADQLRQIAFVLYGNEDALRKKLQVWKVVTGMKWYQYLAIPNNIILNTLDITDFVFKSNELTENLFPRYKKYYGPASDFDNLRVSEFVFSEMFHGKYCETKEIKYLNSLIAVIYRPAKKRYNRARNSDGDIREAFNENLIHDRARIIARWPDDVKLSIFTWYAGCKKMLVKENPQVFGTGGNAQHTSGTSAMLSIMRAVAKAGTYGDFDKVEQLFVKTLMMELREQIRESEDMKRRMKKHG